MRIVKFISLALLIMALVSFAGIPMSYSGSNDDNHLSSNDSIYSPSGYMNKDIQQARTLTDKYLANKDKVEARVNNAQREMSCKVKEDSAVKPKVELKQKKSSKAAKIQSAAVSRIEAGSEKNVKIGSGTDQTYRYSGAQFDMETERITSWTSRTIDSETIDGKRYLYVGFSDNADDTLGNAQWRAAAGDTIIVKSGVYTGAGPWDSLHFDGGVKVYGGYNEKGERDLINAPTIIQNMPVGFSWSDIEVDGFTFIDSRIVIQGASNITLSNCTFKTQNMDGMSQAPINIDSATNITIKNNDFFTPYGVYVLGTYYDVQSYWGQTSNTRGMLSGYSKSSVFTSDNNFYGSEGRIGLDTGPGFSTTPYAVNLSGSSDWISTNDYIEAGYTTPLTQMFSKTNQYNYVDPYTISAGFTTTENIRNQLNFGTDNFLTGTNAYQLQYYTYDLRRDDGLMSLYGNMRDSALGNTFGTGNLSAIFKGLLANKENTSSAQQEGIGQATLASLVVDTLGRSALALPGAMASPQDLEAADKLAAILKNPTEGQKMIISSITALLADVKKIEDASGQDSLELKKASDDLLQMVASVLLAQGVPDLLKGGDVSNIKTIFSELDQARAKIVLEYAESTKPYYENMIKDMAKNMAILQGKNLLNPDMTKEELCKLPPSELDKILEKMRRMKDRSFEEEYILQQEAKYRKDYLEPNKKKLENDMKDMLKSFTGRLNDVLKSAEKK